MSPLNKQQLDQIRDERRVQIKQAALKVFARHGFKGTKTSMIAAEASISEGLIYRYFKSKDELFITLVQELIQEAKTEIESVHHLPGTPSNQIKTFTQNMLDENNKYAFMLILQARKTTELPEGIAETLGQHTANSLDRLVPIVVKGQQTGEFFAGDPRELIAWYFYIIHSIIMQEVEKEEYGLPSVDVLMRILTK